MNPSINSPGHGKNVDDGINIGKLEINNTSMIVTLPSASKDISIKFADQCIHIFNNKDRLN